MISKLGATFGSECSDGGVSPLLLRRPRCRHKGSEEGGNLATTTAAVAEEGRGEGDRVCVCGWAGG